MPRLAELVEWTREEGLPVAVVAVHNAVHTSSASSRLMPDEASIAEYADTIDFYMEGAHDDFDSVYGVRSWPRIFVIDADGVITHVKANSGIDLLAELKEQVEIAGAG
jgi:LDH2 family malate/lactate/ureidoglycolate dehydrogenase